MDYTNAFKGTNSTPPSGIDAFGSAPPPPPPLPPGIYMARVEKGEYCTTKTKGEDAYRIVFQVTDGPHVGTTVMRTWTFGEKAMHYTQVALSAFGLTKSAHLLSPFPPAGKEYHCRLTVAMQRGTDGREFNDIKRIEVLRVVDSPDAAFMLTDESEGGQKK